MLLFIEEQGCYTMLTIQHIKLTDHVSRLHSILHSADILLLLRSCCSSSLQAVCSSSRVEVFDEGVFGYSVNSLDVSPIGMQPFGQVSAFQDGDLTLFESRAITKYVAEVYADQGTCLILKDPKKSAIQTVWMEVENQKFDPTSSKLGWELIFKPMFGQVTDDAVVAEFEKKLEDLLDVYEKRLTDSKYLGGDSFTLADLHHIPNLFILMSSKVKKSFDARPHVSAWAADILSRPAWVKVASMLPK